MTESANTSERSREAVTPARMIGVARTMLANTAFYFEHTLAEEAEYGIVAHDAELGDCLKRFYELASPQLAEWVIDARLFADGEATRPQQVMGAMDAELSAWQRHGIVSSQVQSLSDFTMTLLETQHELLEAEGLDDGVRRRIERGITFAQRQLTI